MIFLLNFTINIKNRDNTNIIVKAEVTLDKLN